ncbi:choice-of-anchor M domain-containing protein [Conexibacter sp. JD483]|uniref:choice-of-anchor M domain-containing protein n=1 Tax=unclassified Conexibacter TaxID=2627773 RepID=UPI00271E6EA0|nr:MULTISPECIES: choice-of-anchor M domain-containing protein [unclassified Conexibacter]MDO8183960.1 choice-of-anchor M domain-containing protein [Conexibacter sp. CPCC 205706]MDO8196952.1 choice-of-anchor M domain-containing protein [Conexibacter sp. CPCC 205762]MDR9369078.1 choice-of-anchor M domain-containing protein [Conexibacter sp. JD483]
MHRTATTAALVLLALALPAGSASAQRAVADQTAYLAPRLDADGELELGLIHGRHDGTGEQWSALADVVLDARAGAQTTVPAWAETFGLTLFGPTGTSFWQTADTTRPEDATTRGTVRVGWTRELLVGQLSSAAAVGTIRSVTTPPGGRVAIYAIGRAAPEEEPNAVLINFDSDGIAAPASYSFWRANNGSRSRTRVAQTWGFSQPGYHCADVEVRATLTNGRQVYDRQPLSIAVGGADPQLAPACPDAGGEVSLQLTSSARADVTQAGDPVTLTAAIGPAVAGTVQFYDDDGSSAGEQPLGAPVTADRGAATLTTSGLTRGVHRLRAVFTPTDTASHGSASATLRRLRVHAPEAYVLDTAADERVHADLAVRDRADASLELGIKVDGADARWQPLAETIIAVPERARATVPDQFALLGAPGSDVWTIPLSQTDGIPWLGVSSEALNATRYQRYTALQLDAVAGIDGGPAPGEVVLWDANDGSKPFFSTRIGLPDAVRMLPSGNHWHAAWSFTAAGVYCLAFGAANRTLAGAPVADAQLLTVVVGDAIDPYRIDTCAQAGVTPAAAPWTPAAAPHGGPVAVADTEGSVARRFYDLVPRLAGDRLELLLHDGSPSGPGTLRSLDDVVLRLGPSARTTVRADDPFLPALGPVGATVWQLDEDVMRNRYLLGWDTTKTSGLDGDLDWTLESVAGPGRFVLADDWGLAHGGTPLLATAGDRLAIWPQRRERGIWSFTAPGVYCLTVALSGTRTGGTPIATRQTLTFLVGDGDPTTVVPCGRGGRATEPPAEEPIPPELRTPETVIPPVPRPPAERPPLIRRRATTVRLSVPGGAPRRATLARTGMLKAVCRLGGPGHCAIVATISPAQARRLQLRLRRGARSLTIGRGTARGGRDGRAVVHVRLGRAVRRSLARTGHVVRITLTATARERGRQPATRQTTLTLRR